MPDYPDCIDKSKLINATTNGMLTSKRFLALPNRNDCSCNTNTLMYSQMHMYSYVYMSKYIDAVVCTMLHIK